MSKKYLSVAFAYVGVVIGAGLASGQDLLQYFLSFGAKGLIGIAVLGVLNVVFGVVALQLGSYYRSGHHDEVFERITHPALRRVIDVVLVFSGFAMGFVMLAGAGANLEQQFGLPAWAGSALCAVLVVLTAFLDFERIMKVIGVFTPMIIVAITILTIYSLATPHPGAPSSTPPPPRSPRRCPTCGSPRLTTSRCASSTASRWPSCSAVRCCASARPAAPGASAAPSSPSSSARTPCACI